MEMPIRERESLMGWIHDTIIGEKKIAQKAPIDRASELMSVMEEATGEMVLPGVRRAEYVWSRAMVAYWMRKKEGFSFMEIGRQMGLHHASIRHYIDKMEDALKYPLLYKDVLPKYEDFANNLYEKEPWKD